MSRPPAHALTAPARTRAQGCERSVITYSSLITACERAGEWSLALEFFRDMPRDGCRPNVVTYNSLLSALSNGARLRLRTGLLLLALPVSAAGVCVCVGSRSKVTGQR